MDKKVPAEPLPEAENGSSETEQTRQQPLQVRHGRRIMQEIGTTHRDVVTTIANTRAIIEMLAPPEADEDDTIVSALEQIILTQRHQHGTIEDIQKDLSAIKKLLEELVRARR